MSTIKLQAASQLIREEHYDAARAVLETVDHPTAYEWLYKLDQVAQRQALSTTDSVTFRRLVLWTRIRRGAIGIAMILYGAFLARDTTSGLIFCIIGFWELQVVYDNNHKPDLAKFQASMAWTPLRLISGIVLIGLGMFLGNIRIELKQTVYIGLLFTAAIIEYLVMQHQLARLQTTDE
jgi:hypothetical protein